MEGEKVLPTRGQLERQLSQTIQSLYREKLGHLPSKVVCHLFSDKLAIVVEDAMTAIEKLLIENSRLDLAENMRSVVNRGFSLQVKQTINEILQVEITDLISQSCLDSNCLGMIAILDSAPKVRFSRKMKNRDRASPALYDREQLSEVATSLSLSADEHS